MSHSFRIYTSKINFTLLIYHHTGQFLVCHNHLLELLLSRAAAPPSVLVGTYFSFRFSDLDLCKYDSNLWYCYAFQFFSTDLLLSLSFI